MNRIAQPTAEHEGVKNENHQDHPPEIMPPSNSLILNAFRNLQMIRRANALTILETHESN